MSRSGVALILLTASLLMAVAVSCGRKKRSKPKVRRDAAMATRRADDAGSPVVRRPDALNKLLARVPGRASWFVALGRPGALLESAGRYWKLLAQIPDLTAPMALVAQRLGKVLGGWPPPAKLWQSLGMDPGGGLVLAGVPDQGGQPSGTLVLVYTRTPKALLRRLVNPGGGGSGRATTAVLAGSSPWWCSAVAPGVACASSRELLPEIKAMSSTAPGRSLVAQVPVKSWRGIDLAGGWRPEVGQPLSSAAVRFRSWGVQARLRLRGGILARWLAWLGPGGKPGSRPADAVASVWLRLDPARVSTLVGLLPTGTLRAAVPGAVALGAAEPPALLTQCTGEAMFVIGPKGWRLRAKRQGPAVLKGEPALWTVSGWPVWARAPVGRLVIASSAAATRPATTATVGTVTGGRAPQPLRALLTRPASAMIRLPLLDPLEALSPSDRARLVAAMVGLPSGERAFVGLMRGVLTLLGEAGISVERTPDGALLRLAFVSPSLGTPAARRDFERLWQAKWQGGGFFDRKQLRQVVTHHRGQPLALLARSLLGLGLQQRWSLYLTDVLLGLLGDLKGPELSCAALSARLTRCAEPFARLRFPRKWREMETIVLTDHRRRLRRAVLKDARREQAALGAHCDRLAGRLENTRQVKACLAAGGCPAFARCLVRAFTPKP